MSALLQWLGIPVTVAEIGPTTDCEDVNGAPLVFEIVSLLPLRLTVKMALENCSSKYVANRLLEFTTDVPFASVVVPTIAECVTPSSVSDQISPVTTEPPLMSAASVFQSVLLRVIPTEGSGLAPNEIVTEKSARLALL